MKKRHLALIVLIGITLTYPLTVHYAIQAYESWKIAELEALPAEMRPFADTSPFIQSFWGGLTIIFGSLIAFFWFVFAVWRPTK